MASSSSPPVPPAEYEDDEGLSLLDLALPLAQHWKLLLIGPLLAGLVALGVTYLMKPTFTSRTVFLPPQQQQSAAATAVAQLGALSGLVSGAAGLKSPADQYVALLQSTSVADRLIHEFKLMQVYDSKYRFEARKELADNSRISLGKKDGLITVEVEDTDPQRAAAIANRHVDELRRLTSQLALTEAQQRRVFFEEQLKKTRDDLTKAQTALEASGFSAGSLRAEPKAAAEGYARLRAEATAAEVRLQTLRRGLSESTPEVQQALATLGALRGQLARTEAPTDLNGGPDYVGRFREFKYQETLFELFARQYELARLDESREGALIQIVDVAQPAERRSWPQRTFVTLTTSGLALLLLATAVVMAHFWRRSLTEPANAARLAELRAASTRAEP
jgi:uncharacterized protein involved in exopolysaccharide biosynthesis